MLKQKGIPFSIGFADFYGCVENCYKTLWFYKEIRFIFQIKKVIE
jgi:hypothetical protein